MRGGPRRGAHGPASLSGQQRARLLGMAHGTQQAYEHLCLVGATLGGEAVAGLARLAWKYEVRAQVGDAAAMRAFVDAYRRAYREVWLHGPDSVPCAPGRGVPPDPSPGRPGRS